MMVSSAGRWFAIAALYVLVSACGGDGGAAASNDPPPSGDTAPSGLSYPAPAPFVVHQAVTPLRPTVTGQVTAYAISPALPAGLTLDAESGAISGTPSALTPQARYVITASNTAGSTSTTLSLTVVDVAPTIAYASPYYTYTAGVSSYVIDPAAGGGAVTSWSIVPSLPTGLVFSTTDGSINGTPSAAAAAASYTVTATNSGGESTAVLTIAVAAAPLLDLGLTGEVTLLRYANSRVLSQDNTGQWLLQDFTTGTTLASGHGDGAYLAPDAFTFVDLANGVMIDGSAAMLEIRSATDGHVLGTIATQPGIVWYRLASDGSYVAGGGPSGLAAWSTSGQMLFSISGDFSKAIPIAAPGQILLALGPAGQNVIQSVSVATGTSSVSPPFQGNFNSWFLDGQRFVTNLGNTVWFYSASAVQQDLTTLSTVAGLAGTGNWFWIISGGALNIYQVGNSSSPAFTVAYDDNGKLIASGQTLALLPYGSGQVTAIDLSGATPTSASYAIPYAYLTDYAASTPSTWVVGNRDGVVFDGTSLGGVPRSLTLGTAWSIAAGSNYISVATASGKILYFNASDASPAGSIAFSSSQLAASTDGTILAAAANSTDNQYEPDRTVNIYSLPSGTSIASYPYSFSNSDLYYLTLAGSGTALGELFASPTPPPAGACATQVIAVGSGASILCDDSVASVGIPDKSYAPGIALSPDGTLIADSGQPTTSVSTNIYKNGTLVTAVAGWPLGWLDNNRLVTQTYVEQAPDTPPVPSSTTVYDAQGNKLGTSSLTSRTPFQVVSGDSVYLPSANTIASVQTGNTTWASGDTQPPTPFGVGAVTPTQVIFAAGSLVLAQPH